MISLLKQCRWHYWKVKTALRTLKSKLKVEKYFGRNFGNKENRSFFVNCICGSIWRWTVLNLTSEIISVKYKHPYHKLRNKWTCDPYGQMTFFSKTIRWWIPSEYTQGYPFLVIPKVFFFLWIHPSWPKNDMPPRVFAGR